MARIFSNYRSKDTPRTYNQDMGWKRQGVANGSYLYRGYYRTKGLHWPGYVQQAGRRITFFIKDPPLGFVRSSRWGGCFHMQTNGWTLVTFKPGEVPKDIDSGIFAISQVLKDSIEKKLATARRR